MAAAVSWVDHSDSSDSDSDGDMQGFTAATRTVPMSMAIIDTSPKDEVTEIDRTASKVAVLMESDSESDEESDTGDNSEVAASSNAAPSPSDKAQAAPSKAKALTKQQKKAVK